MLPLPFRVALSLLPSVQSMTLPHPPYHHNHHHSEPEIRRELDAASRGNVLKRLRSGRSVKLPLLSCSAEVENEWKFTSTLPCVFMLRTGRLYFSSYYYYYYYYYYYAAPRIRVLLKLTVPHLVKKILTFYGTPMFIVVFTTARHYQPSVCLTKPTHAHFVKLSLYTS